MDLKLAICNQMDLKEISKIGIEWNTTIKTCLKVRWGFCAEESIVIQIKSNMLSNIPYNPTLR